MRFKLNLFISLIVAGLATMFVPVAFGDSEIVVAIRYLQAAGTSHSHLYLYREDGKLLRQLTDDSSGQDVDPIFSPDGETIVFTREKTNGEPEFWGIEPHGTNLKRLDGAPEWYKSAKDSPYFTTQDEQEGESGTPSPAPSVEGSPSPSPSPSTDSQETQHTTGTALDASSSVEDRPPTKIDAPDGAGEIFWRKGKDEKDPLDWVMWFRDSKSGHDTEIGQLPGFPSFDPLQVPVGKDRQFLFDGPLRLIFFSSHLNSTD